MTHTPAPPLAVRLEPSLRYINDAQHWLRAVDGSIQRDRLDTSPEIAALESALKLLGHNEGDPMPAQVRDQLAKPQTRS